LDPQDVNYLVQVIKSSQVEWKMKNQVHLSNRAGWNPGFDQYSDLLDRLMSSKLSNSIWSC